MNVITSKDQILRSGENTIAVMDSIVDELAKMIIMVETGRRHFVNGAKVANPDPFFVFPMDFCTINMYVCRATIILLVPDTVDFSNCVTLLIGRVNNALHDLEAEMPGNNVMIKDSNVFTDTKMEYIRTVDSLIMAKEYPNQVMKRIFVSGENRHLPGSAFRWDVVGVFQKTKLTSPDSIWLSDKADIYVNLVAAPLHLFTSHTQIDSIQSVLGHLGVKKIIRYKKLNHKFTNEDYKLKKNQFSISTWGGAGQHGVVKVKKIADIKEIKDKCIYVNYARGVEPCVSQSAASDFFNAFVECKNVTGAPIELCQMCNFGHPRTMYALSKNLDTGVVYAPICKKCLCNNQLFVDLSLSIQIVCYPVNKMFSDVCEYNGFPKTHALLYESESFNHHSRYYARDDRSIAFNTNNVSEPILNAIAKFIHDVPNGEFIIFI